jgi:hypothetical protein
MQAVDRQFVDLNGAKPRRSDHQPADRQCADRYGPDRHSPDRQGSDRRGPHGQRSNCAGRQPYRPDPPNSQRFRHDPLPNQPAVDGKREVTATVPDAIAFGREAQVITFA